MAKVVARMRVNEVALHGYSTGVKLSCVVTSDDPHDEEIKQFFMATPSGRLEMEIRNEAAAEHFQPGDDFYVYLQKVSKNAQ